MVAGWNEVKTGDIIEYVTREIDWTRRALLAASSRSHSTVEESYP